MLNAAVDHFNGMGLFGGGLGDGMDQFGGHATWEAI